MTTMLQINERGRISGTNPRNFILLPEFLFEPLPPAQELDPAKLRENFA